MPLASSPATTCNSVCNTNPSINNNNNSTHSSRDNTHRDKRICYRRFSSAPPQDTSATVAAYVDSAEMDSQTPSFNMNKTATAAATSNPIDGDPVSHGLTQSTPCPTIHADHHQDDDDDDINSKISDSFVASERSYEIHSTYPECKALVASFVTSSADRISELRKTKINWEIAEEDARMLLEEARNRLVAIKKQAPVPPYQGEEGGGGSGDEDDDDQAADDIVSAQTRLDEAKAKLSRIYDALSHSEKCITLTQNAGEQDPALMHYQKAALDILKTTAQDLQETITSTLEPAANLAMQLVSVNEDIAMAKGAFSFQQAVTKNCQWQITCWERYHAVISMGPKKVAQLIDLGVMPDFSGHVLPS